VTTAALITSRQAARQSSPNKQTGPPRHARSDDVGRPVGRNPEHRFQFIQDSAAAVDEDAIDA
jgi:hypothetical protein